MGSSPPTSAERLRPAIWLFLASALLCGSETSAFSTNRGLPAACPRQQNIKPSAAPSAAPHARGSATAVFASRDREQSICGVEVGEERRCYPVQIHHQGHVATVSVREDEPILQALERQSAISSMSHIPHECRRGNCLTCSSRIKPAGNSQNLVANVNNGLSDTISTELTKSGYALTCCSYVTGPGVVLELDQNDEVWDVVYRRRICPSSREMALEAQARLLRRVDEENVGRWKRRMEEGWEGED